MDSEKRVAPLELFFDLVFVFALTQVTARMADDLSWGGLLRGLLVLAAIWWAWAAYAWLTNEVDPRRGGVRLTIFGAMVAMLLASLAIPGAFEDDALLFACAYLGVRLMHVALFAAATDDVNVRHAAQALVPVSTIGPALLIVASAFDGTAQTAVWIVALVLDLAGGAHERDRGLAALARALRRAPRPDRDHRPGRVDRRDRRRRRGARARRG